MQEKPPIGKIVPNSFQTPNALVDEYMRYLLPNEVKCYLVIDRKTLGWLKREDNISLSQIVEFAGINIETARTCMAELCYYGLTVKTGENDPTKNYGDQYALQFDETLINMNALIERYSARKEKATIRMGKARSKISPKDPTLMDSTTPPVLSISTTPTLTDNTTPDSIQQSTQKTLSKDTIKSTESKNKRILGTSASSKTQKKGDAVDWLLQSKADLDYQAGLVEIQQRFERAAGLHPDWASVKDGWVDFTRFLVEKETIGQTIEAFYKWFNADKFRREANIWMKPGKYKLWWDQAFVQVVSKEESIKIKTTEPTPFEKAMLLRGNK